MKHPFVTFSRLILFTGIAIFFLASCNPAKTLVAEGDRLSSENNYENATSFYYSALLKKPSYKPAKDGLKISAQHVLNDKFVLFKSQVLNNRIEDAVKQYQYAAEFYRNAKKVGVELEWPNEYDEVFEDVSREYKGILFDEAVSLMGQKKYDLAERKFNDITAIDSNYRNVSVLRLNTVLDPLYDDGMRLLNAGKYQEAYKIFSKITNLDEDYKDASKRRNEALNKATTRIGILPVLTDKKAAGTAIDKALADQLNQSTHAFVKVIDYFSLKQTLDSRGWSLISTTKDALEAAKSLGLQYILFVKVTCLTDTIIPKTIEKKTAYEAFTENIPNPYTDTYSYITRFKLVQYNDRFEGQYLAYNVNLTMLSVNDEKIIYSDDFELKKADEIHKFDFKGNINNLYEELPKGNYLPPPNKAWREQFTGVKLTLVSRNVLEEQLSKEIAQRIAFDFNKALK